MTHTAHLWLYLVFLIGIIVLPGMDMAYVLGNALSGGLRRGLAAVGGIVAGGVCHTLLAFAGVGTVLHAAPGLFNAMLLAGAAYLAWIGWSLMQSASPLALGPPARATSPAAAFVRGMAVCLMNPKAYLFMLAVLPQFVRPEYGPIAVQAAVLGATTAAVQAAVYGMVALAASRARDWLAGSGRSQVILARAIGLLLMGGAAWSAASAWRG
ncbi:MAG: LysE family translocator [Ottowia sp.]